MTLGRAIVDTLVESGVDTVFGIPGTQTLPMNKAIEGRDDIDFVMSRHETAVPHEAWGYAETTGTPAATLVVPGPGDMNSMNGLKNALNDCTPLIHFSMETEPELRGGDAIHETPPDTYENVVKENIHVKNSEGTIAEVKRALAIAQTPPKGPVRIGIPRNFLEMNVNHATSGRVTREFVSEPPTEEINEAVEVLENARNPIIIAGGGVRSAGAADVLRSVAEKLDAPVFHTHKGKGLLPEDHYLSAGLTFAGAVQALRDVIAEADAALAVGTDFDLLASHNWSFEIPEERLIHVTLNPDDIGTGYSPGLGIMADAGDVLERIDRKLPNREPAGENERVQAIKAANREVLAPLREDTEPPLNSVVALDAIREALPREAIVTADSGGSRLWTLAAFEAYGPHRYLNTGSWASMGTGLPGAIGAQVGNPDVPAVSIVGDGGVMMAIHELHTMATEGIPLTVVILNNSDYAIISDSAKNNFDIERGQYAWEDCPLDFRQISEGMGVRTEQATTPEEIVESVSTAVGMDEPAVVEVRTDPDEPQAIGFMMKSGPNYDR